MFALLLSSCPDLLSLSLFLFLFLSLSLARSLTLNAIRAFQYLQPRIPPRLQILATAPAIPSERLAAMVVFMTSSGWPSVVTSNRFRPEPSSKLLNLTGFFSSFWPPAGVVTAEDML